MFGLVELGIPVHSPCAGFEPQQQALQARQRFETPPYRRARTGAVREARFAGILLGPPGQLGPPMFNVNRMYKSGLSPGLHFCAAAPASAEPELPPGCWEAGQPGTPDSPPEPGFFLM